MRWVTGCAGSSDKDMADAVRVGAVGEVEEGSHVQPPPHGMQGFRRHAGTVLS